MAKYYLHTSTILIFIVCAAAVIGAYWYVGRNSETQNVQAEAVSLQGENDSPASHANEDWRKQFFTGGATSSPLAAAKKVAAPEKLTPTDILARNFLTRYAQLNQAGAANNQDAINTTAQRLIADSISGIPAPKVYTVNDLRVGTDPSAALLSAYGKDLLSILRNMPTKNESEIAKGAMDNNDMTLLKGIDPIIQAYRTIRDSLLVMSVPKPLTQYHLDLINGFSLAFYNATALRHLDTDMMQGLVAVGLEETGLANISTAFANIQNYFDSAGIKFGS